MPYLVDADALIRAKRDHYRFSVFPCFWSWIEQRAASGLVLSVAAIERELLAGNDDLAAWVAGHSAIFLRADTATSNSAQVVSAWVSGATRPYLPAAVSTFFAAADYWLISHALAHGFTVVTHEVGDPRSRRRVKIPDVCAGVGVPCTTPFDMLQAEGTNFIIGP